MIFLIKFKKNDTKVVSYHNNISCKCVYGQYYISRWRTVSIVYQGNTWSVVHYCLFCVRPEV